MGRLHKLDTEVELEIIQHQPSHSPSILGCNYTNNHVYDGYGKEYYFGNLTKNCFQFNTHTHPKTQKCFSFFETTITLGSKHKELLCSDVDDTFMRPPLWEDITSSIQNIDPENAIMLGTIATQVKLEASDENLLEPLSSPLLSPLEIKTEKCHLSSTHSVLHHNSNALHQNNNNNNNNNSSSNNNNNNNNNSYHLSGGNYQHQHQQHQNSLNGYLGGTNGSGSMTLHHSQHQMQNNGGNSSYYNNSWQNHSQVRSIEQLFKAYRLRLECYEHFW